MRAKGSAFPYIWRCKIFLQDELDDAEVGDEGRVEVDIVVVLRVATDKPETGVADLLLETRVIVSVDAPAQRHRARPEIVAPQVSGRVVTRRVVHCWF